MSEELMLNQELSLIEGAKQYSDAEFGGISKISTDLKEIMKYLSEHPKDGVVAEISWGAKTNRGIFMESVIVTITRIGNDRVYYKNTFEGGDDPAFLRRKEKDGTESVTIKDFIEMSKKRPVSAIIRQEDKPA